MAKQTSEDAVQFGNFLLGAGWLLDIALWLSAGGFYIAGIKEVAFVEVEAGTVLTAVLWIARPNSDEKKREVWFRLR